MLVFTMNGLGGFDMDQVKMKGHEECRFSADMVNPQLNGYAKAICVNPGKDE